MEVSHTAPTATVCVAPAVDDVLVLVAAILMAVALTAVELTASTASAPIARAAMLTMIGKNNIFHFDFSRWKQSANRSEEKQITSYTRGKYEAMAQSRRLGNKRGTGKTKKKRKRQQGS